MSDQTQQDAIDHEEINGDATHRDDMEPAPVDEDLQMALGDALGEDLRAAELRQMQTALQKRRAMLMKDLDAADQDERARLQKAFTELDEQIRILAEEAEITEFIEDSVRVGLEMRRLDAG